VSDISAAKQVLPYPTKALKAYVERYNSSHSSADWNIIAGSLDLSNVTDFGGDSRWWGGLEIVEWHRHRWHHFCDDVAYYDLAVTLPEHILVGTYIKFIIKYITARYMSQTVDNAVLTKRGRSKWSRTR